MSEINHKFECVEGAFDTETGQIVCVGKRHYGEVTLCFKCNFHIPFAKIRLFSRDRAVDADVVFDDALVLGKEIERRWNNYERLKRENEELRRVLEIYADSQNWYCGEDEAVHDHDETCLHDNFIPSENGYDLAAKVLLGNYLPEEK